MGEVGRVRVEGGVGEDEGLHSSIIHSLIHAHTHTHTRTYIHGAYIHVGLREAVPGYVLLKLAGVRDLLLCQGLRRHRQP